MTGATLDASNVLPACADTQGEASLCTEAGYFPDMPTDSNDLLAYLNRIRVINTTGQADDNMPGWEDNVIAKAVSYLMQTAYVLPAQRAALYSLMAQTPGFQLIPEMKDAVGRSGVGIEWTFEGDTGAVIFDATTYAYLGTRTWPGPLDLDGPYDGDALIETAVVDHTGTRPDGFRCSTELRNVAVRPCQP